MEEGLLCVTPEQILLIRKENEHVAGEGSDLTMGTRRQEVVLNACPKISSCTFRQGHAFLRRNHLVLQRGGPNWFTAYREEPVWIRNTNLNIRTNNSFTFDC